MMKTPCRQTCGSHIFECIVRDMQSLSFTPGRAFLSSNSTAVPWTVVFEDEGVAGYFYACDRSQEVHEHSILDAMLPVRNQASVAHPNETLLGEAEARLVINVGRTLLNYLDARLT